MTVIITLTSAGSDTGPFNLYSDVDGFVSAFETNVDKGDLLAGYTSYLVPDGTSKIRVMSIGDCTNYSDFSISTTTTTTTEIAPLCKTFFLQAGKVKVATANYVDCYSGTTSIDLDGGDAIKVCAVYNTTYPYFSQEGTGIIQEETVPGCANKVSCDEYLLTAGALDTTYTYFLCSEDVSTTTVVPAGNSITVCVDPDFGVQIVEGDGTAVYVTFCTTTTTTTAP